MSHIYNIGESTLENPLGFFECIFTRNAFKKYHRNFFQISYKNENGTDIEFIYDLVQEVNEEQEYISYIHTSCEKGEFLPRKIFFKDELRSQLIIERDKSYRLIDQNIDQLIKESKNLVLYLKVLIGKLNYLVVKIKENKMISSYDINIQIVYEIIRHLHHKYNPFFTEIESTCIKDAFDNQNKNIDTKAENGNGSLKEMSTPKIPDKNAITGFKWLNKPEENTYRLHEFLELKKIINCDSDTATKFKLAFQGKEINKPLEIKWLFYPRKGQYKPTIYRMIRLLMFELKLLEVIPIKKQLAQTLEMIFVDGQGNALTAFEQTFQEVEKPKKRRNIVEFDFINELKTVMFTDKSSPKE